ncbi:MAG: Ornithine cyclodeaminase [Firmicutes bacterium]|nr:Ornithine cyclodeaminase [Bacillota bacterium]MDI6705190.1 ornithine cyclodeaminase family protein [Bacillota bacterium]
MDSLAYRETIGKKLAIGKEVLYLTKEECMSTGLDTKEIISITRSALEAHGKKETEMPAKIGIHPLKNTFFHAMPALVPGQNACGMKWVECFPQNPARFNLAQTSGLLIFNDMESGFPLAIMDAIWITAKRTPAVSALSARHLANPDAETFGMFGCGVQGVEHVRFMPHEMKKLKKIYVYDISPSRMDSLIEELQPEIGAEIIKGSSVEQVVKSCEVLASATVILEKPDPQVKDEWLQKGQTLLICDLDSFWEIETMRRADKFIVDDIGQHRHFEEAGYYPYGMPENIYAETGEVVAGIKAGRERKDELIVASNIGMAVEDVVMARAVLDRALEMGLGVKLPL